MEKPEAKQFRDLLTGNHSLEVLRSQRSYVWGTDHATEMVADLESEGSFFGTIVLLPSEERFQIVDGQQRITSLFMFLAAIRIRLKQLGNEALAAKVQERLTFVDDVNVQVTGPKLMPPLDIRDAFLTTILDPLWCGDFEIPELRNRKLQVRKIRPVFTAFWKTVATADQARLEELLRNLYSSTFIVLTIKDEAEAFQIFERNNARGQELNAADLLKNYLFSNLADDASIGERWNTVVEKLGSSTIRALKYFCVTQAGHVERREIYRKLKAIGKSSGPDQLLEDLERFSFVYSVVTAPSADALKELLIDYLGSEYFAHEYRLDKARRCLEALQLFGVTQVYPIIVALLNSYDVSTKSKADTEALIRCLRQIESFHFVNSAISGRPGNEIERSYADLASKINQRRQLLEDCNEIRELLHKNKEKRDVFITNFVDVSYSSLGLIYYIFDRVANYGQKLEGAEVLQIYNADARLLKKNYNIEHLLPKSKADSDDFAQVVDNVGNLIAIPLHTNSRLQNKPFPEKVPIMRQYLADNHLAKEFLEAYGDLPDWRDKEIKARAQALAETAFDKVWTI